MRIVGDCRDVLPTLDAGSVQCCVTSPPYWNQRDYNVSGQIGLEKTPEEYIASMVKIFREVMRIITDDGTLWLNALRGGCFIMTHPLKFDRSKFGNKPTRGHPSKGEAERAQELRLLEAAGEIRNLKEQVWFELIPKQNGERACRYRADFVYDKLDNIRGVGAPLWERVVEDHKGRRNRRPGLKTDMYILKRKLMLWAHGIKILET